MATELSTRAPLRAPFTVCMWLTDFCNLDCAYCYAKPFSGGYMDPERVISLIDEFGDMGVFDMTLAGGEPTLHPKWLEIVKRSVSRGVRVGLLTNGLTLTDRLISELEGATTKRNFVVQVSLDSPDPATNDAARGLGARVVQSIERLQKSSLEVQLATVIHRKNYETAHLVIDRFYPDIKRFHFLNLQRTASALKTPDLLLDEQQTLEFWLRLQRHSQRFPPDLFLPSLRIQMRTLGQVEVDPEASLHGTASWECNSCSAGWTHVNVTSKFDVLGCDIAKDFTFMGNCLDHSFEAVWHSQAAENVRNAPHPACYQIEGPDGSKLADHLRPELIPASKLMRAMRPDPRSA